LREQGICREFAGNFANVGLDRCWKGDRMNWFAERPLVLRATLANLLTAASPNAFVLLGRCVKPPGAEDSYCGNPMLLSCSAHE